MSKPRGKYADRKEDEDDLVIYIIHVDYEVNTIEFWNKDGIKLGEIADFGSHGPSQPLEVWKYSEQSKRNLHVATTGSIIEAIGLLDDRIDAR